MAEYKQPMVKFYTGEHLAKVATEGFGNKPKQGDTYQGRVSVLCTMIQTYSTNAGTPKSRDTWLCGRRE